MRAHLALCREIGVLTEDPTNEIRRVDHLEIINVDYPLRFNPSREVVYYVGFACKANLLLMGLVKRVASFRRKSSHDQSVGFAIK